MSDSALATFLLIDDDRVNLVATERAMARLGLRNPIRTAHDGRDALALLRGEDGREPVTTPYVILLDINMPQMDGFELLDELRSDPALADAVVFILSSSNAKADVMRAYRHNVAGYIVKADTVANQLAALAMIEKFTRIVVLPEHEPAS